MEDDIEEVRLVALAEDDLVVLQVHDLRAAWRGREAIHLQRGLSQATGRPRDPAGRKADRSQAQKRARARGTCTILQSCQQTWGGRSWKNLT